MNHSILVAEDEPLTLKMLTYRLNKEGFDVHTATDGKQALEHLEQFKPDFVLTDLLMPYHNGLEVISFVKSKVDTQIPILVLSGLGQESYIKEAMRLGANGFCEKPVNPSELVRSIKELLEHSVS